MIACLHPSDKFFPENYSTLVYAAKTGSIANKPVKNDDFVCFVCSRVVAPSLMQTMLQAVGRHVPSAAR